MSEDKKARKQSPAPAAPVVDPNERRDGESYIARWKRLHRG